ncbi:S8 family serine peptidase [Rhodococcus hoagii]|nr:S8 family serine peptidase [Prescottella equi]
MTRSTGSSTAAPCWGSRRCACHRAADNRTTDTDMPGDAIGALLQELTDEGVCCCLAAGNDYYAHGGMQGMCYPAIFRQTISVGAVYYAERAASVPRRRQGVATDSDRLTPFTQRLHRRSEGPARRTHSHRLADHVVGHPQRHGESIQYGASQATPVVLGVVALLQSFHLRTTGHLPTGRGRQAVAGPRLDRRVRRCGRPRQRQSHRVDRFLA